MHSVALSPAEAQVTRILDIISAYRHHSTSVIDRFAEFIPELQKQLLDTVSKKEPVRFILPAFPFKAPTEDNKRKTLGPLPDKAEEIALQTLDGFADSIAEIYERGAIVVVVSDASVYGDVLKVTDADAFAYQQELQKFASFLNLKHLEFVRLGTLAGIVSKGAQTVEEYSAQVQETRNLLDGTVTQQVNIKEGENIKATSKHYDAALPQTQDPDALKAAMLKRGKAYAKLIASTSQSSIRLSIHESNNFGKITIDLFPPPMNPDFITPWHGAVAALDDASVRIVDASKVEKAKFDIMTNEGRPWLLREKCDLFNWSGMTLNFEPLYPRGMLVKPKEGHGPYKLEDVDMKFVRRLVLSLAPLILQGFIMEVQEEVFRAKAAELGEIQMWGYGDILEVLNMTNTLTNEAMPTQLLYDRRVVLRHQWSEGDLVFNNK